jgi:hypothetical protein
MLGFDRRRLSNSNEKEKELRRPKVGCTERVIQTISTPTPKRGAHVGLFIGGSSIVLLQYLKCL